MSNDSMSRRSFLKSTAATAAIATVASSSLENSFASQPTTLTPGAGNKWPGRVVVNFDKNAVIMNGDASTAQPDVIKKMVDDAIKLLTGEATVGDAWKAIFPSTLTAQSKIAIKVPCGCAITKIAPHWASVKAMTDGLQLMDIGGSKLPASNITIYDMNCSNNLSKCGYNSSNFGSVKIVFDSLGSGYTDGARNLQYARSLHDANFLINVFRPGGHSSYAEGLTLGFKNHYGTYAAAFHDSQTPPHLRDINCTGVVNNKNVLSVCVGIYGAQEASGSPGSNAISYYTYAQRIDTAINNPNKEYPPCTIIMSTDPITAEMQTIKMMRLNNEPAKDYTVNAMPKYLKSSAGITGALDKTYNIGIIDETKMDIRKIVNEQIITTNILKNGPINHLPEASINAIQVHNARTIFIDYTVPLSIVGENASIEIFDINGRLINQFKFKIAGINNHYSWDEKDMTGKYVSKGTYVVNLIIQNNQLTTNISIVR